MGAGDVTRHEKGVEYFAILTGQTKTGRIFTFSNTFAVTSPAKDSRDLYLHVYNEACARNCPGEGAVTLFYQATVNRLPHRRWWQR